MALRVEWTDEELPQVQDLLNRALNTWDPKTAPKWAWELNARVEAKIKDLKVAPVSGEKV